MFSVHQTLSLRYLQRRWLRAILIVASIALGVATLVATRALNETMTSGAVASGNPMAGLADFLVSKGEDVTMDRSLVGELRSVAGVKSVQPLIFRSAYLPEFDKNVLVMGIDLLDNVKDFRDPQNKDAIILGESTISNYAKYEAANRFLPKMFKQTPVVVGKALADEIPEGTYFIKVIKDAHDPKDKGQRLAYVPFIDGTGNLSFLGGNILILDLPNAAAFFGMKENQVHRIDITLEATADHDKVRKELEKVLKNPAWLKTPEEQNQSLQSAMSGMQIAFSLNGVAALVVGMFLMYNALAVTVAERRHEIGILRSVGATRGQVHRLLAAEAGLLGLIGSLLGLPLGWWLATLGLGPLQGIVEENFTKIQAHSVELDPVLLIAAVIVGVATAILAGLIPAMQATRENPAEAVRTVAKATTLRHLTAQLITSVTMILAGALCILLRGIIPYRFGTYGGLMLVLVGALVASPFIAAVFARLFQPLARACLSIEWRLAADNLVRSPGRTGLVIGALAAGVSLVVLTAGTIRSNRLALRDWVRDNFAADLKILAGGPVSAGQDMDESIGAELRQLPEVEAVLPTHRIKPVWENTNIIVVLSVNAGQEHAMTARRFGQTATCKLMKQLSEQPGTVIVSENFAALNHVRTGDAITAPGHETDKLRVIGQVIDYSWNHGVLIMNHDDFKKYWPDAKVCQFDVYLKDGVDVRRGKEIVNKRIGAQTLVMTQPELQHHIKERIERLYSIAFAQQVVVILVAVLGVVMALLISVLQRRRELGLLRAIGAWRGQVIYSVLAEACLMGIIGTTIGLLVGIPVQWYVLRIVILEESGYLFPVYVPWVGGLIIAAAAMAVATLAGLGPAIHAVRMRIPEAIAYE